LGKSETNLFPVNRDGRVTMNFRFRCEKKKADVTHRPKAVNHVGLLINGPVASCGLPFV
jgi:hypothetical protein